MEPSAADTINVEKRRDSALVWCKLRELSRAERSAVVFAEKSEESSSLTGPTAPTAPTAAAPGKIVVLDRSGGGGDDDDGGGDAGGVGVGGAARTMLMCQCCLRICE